jgi:hypothetical protein
MKYIGALYGKVAGRYLPLEKLASDVDALERHAELLEAALRPFATLDISDVEDRKDDLPIYGRNESIILLGDIRKARTALGENNGR